MLLPCMPATSLTTKIDGAARVLDPVFSAVNDAKPLYGLFLKDYKPTSW